MPSERERITVWRCPECGHPTPRLPPEFKQVPECWVCAEPFKQDPEDYAPAAALDEALDALQPLIALAEDARGHHGIEESNPRDPTEWDEIQDGLAAAAAYAREVCERLNP